MKRIRIYCYVRMEEKLSRKLARVVKSESGDFKSLEDYIASIMLSRS